MRRLLRTVCLSPQSVRVRKGAVDSQGRKSGILQIAKFGVASGIGFLVAELILTLGITASYHTIEVSSLAYSSPFILELDALAFGVGVTVAFAINERVTFRHRRHEESGGPARLLVMWCKYQVASLLGNTVIVGVQLTLLATISLSPVLGNILGAIISYPLTYVVSNYFVWGTRTLRADAVERRTHNNRAQSGRSVRRCSLTLLRILPTT